MLKKNSFLNTFILLVALSATSIQAQKAVDIIDAFEDYVEAPREVIYVHLNKSTYIEGEMLGFTTYIFDKFTKSPALMTENLYCTISDSDGKIIKKKLLRVKNGVVSNAFDIDSTLSTGVFTFKAYTNWMRNFREKNHFEQTFKVINAENLELIKPVGLSDFKIDLQALGEGGHLVYGITNTLAIIAKNQFQQGLKNFKGEIVNDNDEVLSEFKLNDVGIAKTVFNPELNKRYFVKIDFNGNIIRKEILNIENKGISLVLADLGEKVIIKLKANALFLNQFKDDTFKAALHNGSELALTEFSLNNEGTVLLSYPKTSLFSGMNIFTIFTSDNAPLLERLYFNSIGINNNDINVVKSLKTNDSIDINLKLQEFKSGSLSNISISVLPEKTKSYNHNNNLLSQLYIQPYVNGVIENGFQYFSDDKKANYNLELLLLTQGWSSYDWNTIFNYNDVFAYPFERGIDIVSSINGSHEGTYVIYPINDASTQLYEIKDNDKEFTIKNRFPTEDDLFRVGYIDTKAKGFRKKPSLYMQYFPSQFPDFNLSYVIPIETFQSQFTSESEVEQVKSWGQGEILDEVVVEASKDYTRAQELSNKAINSKIEIIDELQKSRNQRVDLYLQRLGFQTDYDYFSGTLSITNPRVNWGTNVPLVYLDDALLTSDFTPLTFIYTQDVDYIEYEWYGFGGGLRGQAGFIKIYTTKSFGSKGKNDNVQTYDIPLRFSKKKKMYIPRYQEYNSNFFNEYGTIDWKPKIDLKDDGSFDIRVLNTKNNIKLFIEGFTGDKHISKEILIEN
jgi:hypothetical protein